ncbi:protein of unknown function [Brochothrix thermosphacta]|nr:protein of unknown function [Brochothrix thermosphacta]
MRYEINWLNSEEFKHIICLFVHSVFKGQSLIEQLFNLTMFSD